MIQNPGYILKELAGVPYLLPYGQMIADHRHGIKLNETGVFFWQLLKDDLTLEEILYAGKKHYHITPDNAADFEEDIKAFIQTLLAHNILLSSDFGIVTAVSDEKYICIAGLTLKLIQFQNAFPMEFEPFLCDSRDIVDQTVRFIPHHPPYHENGRLILRNQELNILEATEHYIFTLPQTRDIFEIHLSKDGSHVTVYAVPTLTAQFQYDLFHALRLPFLYLAQLHNMAALHSASILYKEKAWLFSGPSGTGKSTHANLWKTHLDIPILNGDLNLLTYQNGAPVIHGIPWCGTSGICDTNTHNLGGIILLKQAPANFISEPPPDEQILLVSQRLISPSWTKEQFRQNLCLIEKLTQNISICRLHCTPEKEAMDSIKQYIDQNQN